MAETAPCDFQSALANFGGMEEILIDAAEAFLQECPQLMSTIQAAQAAGDAAAVGRAAHTLKSSTGIFAAREAAAAAQQMEEVASRDDLAGYDQAWMELQREIECMMQAVRQFVTQSKSN